MTNRCSICGSYAINIDQAGVLCDVHFYKVQRDELLEALKDARSTLTTALRSTAADWFPDAESVKEHLCIKKIDAAISKAGGAA